MPLERSSVFEETQIGAEVTAGTAVACNRRMQSISIVPEVKVKIDPFTPQGYKYGTITGYEMEWTTAKIDGLADYADAVYPLSGLFGAATITTPTGGTTSRQWVWNVYGNQADTPQTFTIQSGSAARAGQMTYGLCDEFGLTYSREQAMKAAGAMLGQLYTDGATLTPPTNEVQSLVATGATAGTFTLTFGGQTTAGIAYNAAASAVQSALAALSSIGAGNVACAGGPLPTTAVTITFQGALGGQKQALITANSTGLTGGTAAITETTAGAALDVPAVPVFGPHVNVYVDTSAANLGTTQYTRVFDAAWKISGKWGPVWTLNGSNGSFAVHTELKPKTSLTLTLEADANGMGLLSTMRAGATAFVRIDASPGNTSSPTYIEGSIPYRLRADIAAKVTNVQPFKDNKGIWAISWDFEWVADATWGKAAEFTAVNTLAAL